MNPEITNILQREYKEYTVNDKRRFKFDVGRFAPVQN